MILTSIIVKDLEAKYISEIDLQIWVDFDDSYVLHQHLMPKIIPE